jgi:uncharacterized protein YcfL
VFGKQGLTLMKKNFVFIIMAVAGVLLAGCGSPPESQSLPDVTFTHLPMYNIDVAKIDVQTTYAVPSGAAGHVETLLPLVPAVVLERWARDRLRPVGGLGVLRVIIEDARVTETELPMDSSLGEMLTNQQRYRYDMNVRVRLRLMDGNGQERATTFAQANRSITMSEDVSLNERDQIWFDTVAALVRDFDQNMNASILKYLSVWLR